MEIPIAFIRKAMSLWAVAFPGCNGKVKELALKGTREVYAEDREAGLG